MTALFPPQVAIQLSQNQKVNRDGTVTYGEPSTGTGKIVTISVKKSFYPPDQGSTANLCRYTHTLYPGGTKVFKLAQVLDDDNKPISLITGGTPNVTSVSAYYWKDKPGETLLIEVVTIDYLGIITYYSKSSDRESWTKIYETRSPLTPEELETKLDDLVCQHYESVTLDLSSKNSKNLTDGISNYDNDSNNNTYCCAYHNGQGKITVNKGSVSCTEHFNDPSPTHPSSAPFFKHDITSGRTSKVAAIKYYPNSSGPRRRINIPDLADFQKGSLTLYVFHCTGEAPILIYVKGGPQEVDKKWFKKPNSSNGKYEDWTKVESLSIRPDELNGNIQCDQYKELVKELECKNHKDCPSSQHTSTAPESDPPTSPISPAALSEGTPDEAQAATETDASASDVSEAKPVITTATTGGVFAGYIVFGVFGGSGAAGLAGWKLYKNFKGDPWVRQI
ncbi:hypothetical protein BEWA_003780 [Theileria equi strain WA]|uniref:Uncharacterized protein n=1 Tax=Theileria equi strain WA TaxID=1537102 RepID=L0AZI5_THEEQ|nr:hypothetical protein BEWA_003780 [Theileria equi strain WA]AFZ80970.1 hypothetical protein BEWA_003780 [Theileria equi strain WA]|eukprot:XP_004830636.1 hypothetical protein BEWA_003780 [Theileria equi strain WA]